MTIDMCYKYTVGYPGFDIINITFICQVLAPWYKLIIIGLWRLYAIRNAYSVSCISDAMCITYELLFAISIIFSTSTNRSHRSQPSNRFTRYEIVSVEELASGHNNIFAVCNCVLRKWIMPFSNFNWQRKFKCETAHNSSNIILPYGIARGCNTALISKVKRHALGK